MEEGVFLLKAFSRVLFQRVSSIFYTSLCILQEQLCQTDFFELFLRVSLARESWNFYFTLPTYLALQVAPSCVLLSSITVIYYIYVRLYQFGSLVCFAFARAVARKTRLSREAVSYFIIDCDIRVSLRSEDKRARSTCHARFALLAQRVGVITKMIRATDRHHAATFAMTVKTKNLIWSKKIPRYIVSACTSRVVKYVPRAIKILRRRAIKN